jgi:hypothetical protein
MAVGVIARKRLQRISRMTGQRAAFTTQPTLDMPPGELEERLRFDLRGERSGGLRGLARRTVMRTIRPYTRRQRQLDEAMARSLRRLALEQDALRDARERDRNRIARLERKLRGR